MTNPGLNPNLQIIDLKTGKLTREGFKLFQTLSQSVADATSEFVRVDAIQTLTNKTIDGDVNTLRDVPTTGLKSRTGDGARVATATASGTSGNLVAWDGTGNVGDAGAPLSAYLTSASASATYYPRLGGTVTGPVVSSDATSGIGYATGAGGTVTQATDKTTGVSLARATGQITMNAAALAAATTVSFTLTSPAIAPTDILLLNHISGGTAGAYLLNAQCGSGTATINVRNITAGSLSEAIVIAFAVVKAVTA